MKPEKVFEPRGLTTAFFLSKLFLWKRIIRTRLTLYWNAFVVCICEFFLIYVYCSCGFNIEFSSLRRRRCFYSEQRGWFLSRQRSTAGLLEINSNQFRHIFVILCAIRFSENFFKILIVSKLKKPQCIRKLIKQDLIKVLFNLFIQKPLYYVFISLKM